MFNTNDLVESFKGIGSEEIENDTDGINLTMGELSMLFIKGNEERLSAVILQTDSEEWIEKTITVGKAEYHFSKR